MNGFIFICHDTSFVRERLAAELEKTGERLVDLGSDQTSLHNPYNGGYYPVQVRLSVVTETAYETKILMFHMKMYEIRETVILYSARSFLVLVL